jgi:ferredoxin-like protein FixX
MENLLGRTPPSKSPSTGVAEAVVQVQVEKLTTVAATVDKGSIWSRIDDNDEVIRLISMHSDPKNVQYDQQDGMVHVHETRRPLNPNPPRIHDNDTPLEILTRAIEGKGLDAIQKFFETSWSLYLSNTGGQIEFQEVLPLLVSGPCIFFYTFRLDRDFNEHYTIEYELQDGTKSELYKSTLTTVEGIQQSLASIAAMGIFVYRGYEKKEVQLRPKVFFIGTHRDLLPSNSAESIIAEKDKYLQASTRQFVDIIEFVSSSRMIFTVDNFSEDKSAFQKIRSAVERAVERHEFEMVCPSHWLIFSFALRRFEQETVSYEECFEVAKQCGIVDEEELNNALHFIHTKMGLIRYFPHEYIKDIVVVKPQLLYDKISELIVKTFTFDKAGKHSADVFKENGIFSVAEFERICRRSGEGSMKAPQFAKLLEKLRITAPLERDGDKVTKYFVPCVLAHAAKSKEHIEAVILSAEIPPFAIIFKCGYCPKGLGGALISYLMAIENSDLEWKLLTDCIFRDQVTFEVGPLDTVVLKVLSSHLIVACISNSKRTLRRDCSIEKVCIDIRKAVEAGIKQVALDINFIDSEIEHSLTFLCPCDKCLSQYPADMKNFDGKPHCLRCTKTRVCCELPQGYENWFHAKSQRQTVPITEYYFKEDDLNDIMLILTKHAAQWREIGTGLKFSEYELDNIANMPRLYNNSPISWLREMMLKWFQWAPRDNRGSTSFATLEALKDSLNKAGFAVTAKDLSKHFEHKLAVHSR